MRNKLWKIGVPVMAGVVLCGALVYYNFFDTVPDGKTVGDPCPDFTLATYGVENGDFVTSENTFTLSDHKDKVVVLNFWASYCEPCKKEIPHFNEFYEQYKDAVEVVIINGETSYSESSLLDKVLNDESKGDYGKYYHSWTDFTCTFARFEKSSNDVLGQFDVSGALPVTVVVDRLGIIRYISESSMSKAELEAIVLPLTK